jgi:hypothetical protein
MGQCNVIPVALRGRRGRVTVSQWLYYTELFRTIRSSLHILHVDTEPKLATMTDKCLSHKFHLVALSELFDVVEDDYYIPKYEVTAIYGNGYMSGVKIVKEIL